MKLVHHYYVYIVQCKERFYYTDTSNNLEKRVREHNEGKNIFSFTYKRRLVALKYFEHFTDVKQTIAREKQLKGWRRGKKEALFNENYDLLRGLSKATVRQASTATLRRGSG